MFEKLKELVEELEKEPLKNYRVAKEHRSILQLIKLEAQNLRNIISEKAKAKDYTK
jgi:hypothetical protein